MRRLALAAVFVLAAASTSSGQWLEKMVGLPDSLCGPEDADLCVYSLADNAFYVAGYGAGYELDHCLLVIDGTTNERVARIPLPSGVRAMCPVSSEAKLYCAGAENPVVYVIDVHSRAVARTLDFGGHVRFLLHIDALDKLYCALATDTVLVVDTRSDSLVGRVAVPFPAEGVCYSRQSCKLYCTFDSHDSSGVAVIDCSADTLLRVLPLAADDESEPLCNQLDDKLYVIDRDSRLLSVVDCSTDSILAELALSYVGHCVSCHNTCDNKVYFANDDGPITVVCGAGDSVIGEVYFNVDVLGLAYDSLVNSILVAGSDPELVLVDGSADTLVAEWDLGGHELRSVCFGVFGSKACGVGHMAVVVDPPNAELLARHPLSFRFYQYPVAWNPVLHRVYCIGQYTGCDTDWLVVVDGDSLRVRSRLPLEPAVAPRRVYYVPGSDKVYLTSTDLHVVACGPDTVIARFPVGRTHLVQASPSGAKLYAVSAIRMVVVDCLADTVIRNVAIPAGSPTALGLHPQRDKVYLGLGLSGAGRIAIFDGDADTLMATLDVNRGPVDFCYVPGRDAVFASVIGRLHVIGGESNQVEGQVGLFPSQDFLMAYNSRRNKLYCVSVRQVAVVDCSTLSIVARVPLDSGSPRWPVYDSLSDKLYITHGFDNVVTVLDCTSDSLLGDVAIGSGPLPPVWDQARQRLYVPCNYAAAISVVRDSTLAGVREQHTGKVLEPGVSAQTIVRRVLELPGRRVDGEQTPAALLDAAGRVTMLLRPGANDVSHLAPGVYFVRMGDAPGPSDIRKVIVQR
jgi:DNA-binding beta-propeller fold protein YncE